MVPGAQVLASTHSRALVDQVQSAGWHRVHWDARDERGRALAAGIYLGALRYPGGRQTRRLVYLE